MRKRFTHSDNDILGLNLTSQACKYENVGPFAMDNSDFILGPLEMTAFFWLFVEWIMTAIWTHFLVKWINFIYNDSILKLELGLR